MRFVTVNDARSSNHIEGVQYVTRKMCGVDGSVLKFFCVKSQLSALRILWRVQSSFLTRRFKLEVHARINKSDRFRVTPIDVLRKNSVRMTKSI